MFNFSTVFHTIFVFLLFLFFVFFSHSHYTELRYVKKMKEKRYYEDNLFI